MDKPKTYDEFLKYLEKEGISIKFAKQGEEKRVSGFDYTPPSRMPPFTHRQLNSVYLSDFLAVVKNVKPNEPADSANADILSQIEQLCSETLNQNVEVRK